MASQLHLKCKEAIESWAQATAQRKAGSLIPHAKRLLNSDLDPVVFVLMRSIFSAMEDDRTVSGISVEIGSQIDFELTGQELWNESHHNKQYLLEYLKQTKKNKDQLYRSLRRLYIEEQILPEWDLKERHKIGITFLYLFRNISGLIDFINVSYGDKRLRTMVVVTPAAQDWIQKYNAHAEFLRPVRYPTVIPPKPWTDLWSGGYHSDINFPLVKIRRKADLVELKKHPMQRVMEAVNGMQSVPWKVNRRILEVMREYHRLGLSVNEILPFNGTLPLPNRVETEDIEQIKEYKRQAHHVHLTNYQNRAKCLAIAKLLCTAETVKNYDAIYFPVQLDFRGRMYCFNETLHYQGGDTARALLEFSDAKPIGNDGMYWMAIHGANKWGMDKRPFAERLDWVNANMENIRRSAEDPITFNWWTMAEDPWQFLAFCMEFAIAHPDKPSRLPCSLDATNNGLQILSLLMRDPEGARRTNVSSGEGQVSDIYQAVAEALIDKLHTMNESKAYSLLNSGVVDRKLVKQVVMTIPYGVTHYGIVGMLDASLAKLLFNSPDAQKHIPMSERREMSKWLTPVLLEVMEPFVGKSRQAMKWLRDMARVIAKEDRVARWISPSGFPVNNEYRKHDCINVQTAIGEKIDYRLLAPENDERDPSAAKRTISPNFVHSLDASAAHLVARELDFAKVSFGIVHDCFFTHASDIPLVRHVVRQQYKQVFSRDLLENLRHQFNAQHRDLQFPAVPTFGDFDVDEILRSEYFLS
jgi:DNA-directed RNA polymerase